jgi:hypothetical protein
MRTMTARDQFKKVSGRDPQGFGTKTNRLAVNRQTLTLRNENTLHFGGCSIRTCEVSRGFSQSSHVYAWILVPLGRDNFFPDPLRFISFQSPHHSTLQSQ